MKKKGDINMFMSQEQIDKINNGHLEDLKEKLESVTNLNRKIKVLLEKYPEAKPKDITVCKACGEKFQYMSSGEFEKDWHISPCGRDNYTGIDCPKCGKSNWGSSSALKTETEWPFEEYGII